MGNHTIEGEFWKNELSKLEDRIEWWILLEFYLLSIYYNIWDFKGGQMKKSSVTLVNK